MVRTIEVSHWGNIAVEETFHVKHTGAELKVKFKSISYYYILLYSTFQVTYHPFARSESFASAWSTRLTRECAQIFAVDPLA